MDVVTELLSKHSLSLRVLFCALHCSVLPVEKRRSSVEEEEEEEEIQIDFYDDRVCA